MSIEYILVNRSKQELISFSHLNGCKQRELAGNPAQSAIVTWYLLTHRGDEIQFVPDSSDEWPFSGGVKRELSKYQDITEEVLSQLIAEGILKDNGFSYVDEDEPDTVYVKDIINIWGA